MRQHRFQGLEEIATCACLTSTKPKTLHLKACSLGPRRLWNRGRILQWGLKTVGPFYSDAMPAALATARIQTVGACYRGHLKSWAHFTAGQCLLAKPQHELKHGKMLQRAPKIVDAFYSGGMPAALAPEGIKTVGAFYNGVWKSWVHLIAGLCLQPWPQKELKS